MTNYVKLTDFAAKDALVSGNPAKLIKGSEINDEFNALQNSIATKADLSSPAFTGNPTAATQALGNNSTRLANTAFVQQEIADAETAINITGGTITAVDITDVIITDAVISGLVSPIVVADGGTGKVSLAANNVLLGNGIDPILTVSPSTSGNVLTADGTSWVSSPKLISGTALSSSSGTTIDFTGIPSWVKRITVMFNGVSTSGASVIQIQLGDSGGIETTGYLGGANTSSVFAASSTGAVLVGNSLATRVAYGIIQITNLSGNTWTIGGSLGFSEPITSSCGSSKTLSDVLTQIRITTVNGTDTFDAGTINIMYE